MSRFFRKWTPEEKERLRTLHGTMSVESMAVEMNRSKGSIRGQLTQLGLDSRRLWSQEELDALRQVYGRAGRAGSDGALGLKDFALEVGRDAKNISRKARELGLPTNQSRKKVERRKRCAKYDTAEERSQAMSEYRRAWHRENDHPRGMKGKKHSDDTRKRLSATSRAANLFLTEDQRADRIMKALKTRVANRSGCIAPKVQRGSWQAGWREVGGKRNYYRSRWEANYARYLEWLKARGEIADWEHEPETFWFEAVKRGVRSYLPDFRVWENDGTSCLHEVKGWMDQRSKTTLKRMAKYHPEQRIVLIDGPQYRSIRLKVMRLVAGWEDSKRDTHG